MSQQYQKQKEKWFNKGKQQALKEIEELIDKNIFIQHKFLNEETKLQKSYMWRIIGFEELKQQLQKLDNQSQEKQSARLTEDRGVKSPPDTKLKEIK